MPFPGHAVLPTLRFQPTPQLSLSSWTRDGPVCTHSRSFGHKERGEGACSTVRTPHSPQGKAQLPHFPPLCTLGVSDTQLCAESHPQLWGQGSSLSPREGLEHSLSPPTLGTSLALSLLPAAERTRSAAVTPSLCPIPLLGGWRAASAHAHQCALTPGPG